MSSNGFPVHVFPTKIQKMIESMVNSLGFLPDYISAALLVAFAGAVGKTYKLRIKETWDVPVCLFLMLMGNPGVNKSSPLKFALKPLLDKTEMFFRNKADGKNGNNQPTMEYMFSTNIEKQIVVSNATIESIFQLMSEDYVRLTIYVDEIASFFLNMGRYSKGSDSQFYINFFNGESFPLNRKSVESFYMKDTYVCIAGTIQPAVFSDIFKRQKDNGTLERYLIVYPEDVRRRGLSTTELEPTVVATYTGIIQKLLEFEMPNGESNIIRFSPEALNEAIDWTSKEAELANSEPDSRIQGLYAKEEAYFFRFSLLMQLLYSVCDDESREYVGVKAVTAAKELTRYFHVMGIRALGLLSNDPVDSLTELQKKVLQALPERFQTWKAVHIAISNGMPERTFKNLLNRGDLFKKEKMGNYSRLY